MSRREAKVLIEDIIESIDKIFSYTHGLNVEQFKTNSLIIDAVVRNIEIIGEASKNIPEEIKKSSKNIPWHKLGGIRNRIIHEYFGVDTNIIWYVVENELASLKEELKKL